MGRYRKIDPRIWNDAKFRALTDRGKLAFLFILTHPHLTMIGAMRASMKGLADEMGWPEKAFRQAFREASKKGMLEADDHACYVGVPHFLRYNKPESPNVVKSWSTALDLIPECDCKWELIQQVKAFAEGLTKGFAQALPKDFREAFRKPSANQEQEQEHEHEQENPPTPLGGGNGYTPEFERFWQTYNKRRREKKPTAFARWKKDPNGLAPTASEIPDTVIAAAAEQSARWDREGKETQFIPHPSSWLGARRWEDEVKDDMPLLSEQSKRSVAAMEDYIRRHADE